MSFVIFSKVIEAREAEKARLLWLMFLAKNSKRPVKTMGTLGTGLRPSAHAVGASRLSNIFNVSCYFPNIFGCTLFRVKYE